MKIYTDASTRSNVSGLAFIVTDAKNKVQCRRASVVEEKDNNTAELRAICYALAYTKSVDEPVVLMTDSTYAIQAIRGGYHRPNEEKLIEYIHSHLKNRKCNIFWVKGHNRDGTVLSYFNKEADKLAKHVRKEYEYSAVKQKKIDKQKRLEAALVSKKGKNR